MARFYFYVYHEPNGSRSQSTLVWDVVVDDDYDLNDELQTLEQRDLLPTGCWYAEVESYCTDIAFISDEGKMVNAGWIELRGDSPEQARKWIDEIGHSLDGDE